MKDGIIELDSPFGKEISFTSDKFKASWLWKKGNRIYISMIWAIEENKGYFTELVKKIKEKGYEIAIPTPLGIMEYIVRKWNFKRTFEYDKNLKIGQKFGLSKICQKNYEKNLDKRWKIKKVEQN